MLALSFIVVLADLDPHDILFRASNGFSFVLSYVKLLNRIEESIVFSYSAKSSAKSRPIMNCHNEPFVSFRWWFCYLIFVAGEQHKR